jgi:hypothetical protein
MYKPDCGHSERRLGGITCLSLTGWLFTIVFTYIGFACMITGGPAAPVHLLQLDTSAHSECAYTLSHLLSCVCPLACIDPNASVCGLQAAACVF